MPWPCWHPFGTRAQLALCWHPRCHPSDTLRVLTNALRWPKTIFFLLFFNDTPWESPLPTYICATFLILRCPSENPSFSQVRHWCAPDLLPPGSPGMQRPTTPCSADSNSVWNVGSTQPTSCGVFGRLIVRSGRCKMPLAKKQLRIKKDKVQRQ